MKISIEQQEDFCVNCLSKPCDHILIKLKNNNGIQLNLCKSCQNALVTGLLNNLKEKN